MSILLGMLAVVVFAGGVVAYWGAWLCHWRADQAGWWNHPWTGVVVLTILATTSGPLTVWVQGGPRSGMGAGLLRLSFWAISMLLYVPLLTFHAADLLARLLRHQSQPPPEPEDPFERAVAAEERGDVRAAVERFSKLLEDEPARAEARTHLAKVLARTRRLSQAVAVIEEGLALDEVPHARKAGWQDLLRAWAEGGPEEVPPENADLEVLAIHKIRTVRMEAHEDAGRNEGEEEGAI